MKTKLNITNFDFYYGDFRALKDINIEIPENRITAIIGPSGCGKSTFIRSINRMNDLIPNVHTEGKFFWKVKICWNWMSWIFADGLAWFSNALIHFQNPFLTM